jgi:hypothetical protein
MKSYNIPINKTLFYNLILFDFILLESSSKKISNFFIDKFKNKKFIISRIALFPLIKNFKRFIRLLQFLKNISLESVKKKFAKNSLKKYTFINFFFFFCIEQNLELLLLLLKKYNLSCFLHLSKILPTLKSNFFLKTCFIFDQSLNLHNFFSFFFKKFYLLHSFNSFLDYNSFTIFKIFADFKDYKKLIFLGLIFISIFKK